MNETNKKTVHLTIQENTPGIVNWINRNESFRKVSDDVHTFYQDLSYHGDIMMLYPILHETEYLIIKGEPWKYDIDQKKLWPDKVVLTNKVTWFQKLLERFEKTAGEVSRCQNISRTKVFVNVTENIA